jgi:voltage-gated sodium channel
MIRAKTRIMHESDTFSMVMAFFIVLGFLSDIAEAQVMPEEGSQTEQSFILFDLLITIVFTIELLINIFAHSDDGFRPFYTRLANWFDTLIVVVSVANVILRQAGVELPNAKLLRLLRIGRVVRLFSALKDLQKILNACSSAVIPVCNAFFILLIIASVYAIVGNYYFNTVSPEYFGTFHASLFTMFQVSVCLRAGSI